MRHATLYLEASTLSSTFIRTDLWVSLRNSSNLGYNYWIDFNISHYRLISISKAQTFKSYKSKFIRKWKGMQVLNDLDYTATLLVRPPNSSSFDFTVWKVWKKAIWSGYILDIQNVFFFSITLQSELKSKSFHLYFNQVWRWLTDSETNLGTVRSKHEKQTSELQVQWSPKHVGIEMVLCRCSSTLHS